MMTRGPMALVLALLALGCGSDSNVTVVNNNPMGTVGGIVFDAATRAGLAGAKVSITTANGTQTAEANAEGFWQIAKVPAGGMIVQISQMGYQTANFRQTLDGAAGNFPVNDRQLTVGPIGLVKTSGTFAVRVLDQVGAPAPGVRLVLRTQVRHVDFSNGNAVAQGTMEVVGMSGMDGLAAFSGLPDYNALGKIVSSNVLIDAPPMKLNGANAYSFLGATFTFDLNQLPDTVPSIVLAGPRTALAVLQSNVEWVRSGAAGPVGAQIGAVGPITVAFNQAINPATVRASFTLEDGRNAPVQAMTAVETNLLSVTPSASLVPGARYNLVLHVDALAALMNNSEFNTVAPFFVQHGAEGVGVSTAIGMEAKLDSPGVLSFTLTEPIGVGRGISGALSCVAFYEGVDLDGDAAVAFPGEWHQGGSPSALVCPTAASGTAINITQITPKETAPLTGFASRWELRFDTPMTTGGCAPAMPMCTKPASGTKVHLVFSKLDAASTVRRSDGQPLGDHLVVTIP